MNEVDGKENTVAEIGSDCEIEDTGDSLVLRMGGRGYEILSRLAKFLNESPEWGWTDETPLTIAANAGLFFTAENLCEDDEHALEELDVLMDAYDHPRDFNRRAIDAALAKAD